MCLRHRQSGHVLWLIVIVLGSLAQLAIITIQQAAASGLSVRRIEAYWQRETLLEHIASHLHGLPLQRVSAPDQHALWHPLDSLLRTACAAEPRKAFTQTPCLPATNSRWSWQLVRETDSPQAWPGALTQRYRLRVQASSTNGQVSHWQFDYEQRSLP